MYVRISLKKASRLTQGVCDKNVWMFSTIVLHGRRRVWRKPDLTFLGIKSDRAIAVCTKNVCVPLIKVDLRIDSISIQRA